MYRNRIKEQFYRDLVVENIIQRRLDKQRLHEAAGGENSLQASQPDNLKPNSSFVGYTTDGGKSIGGGFAGLAGDPSPAPPMRQGSTRWWNERGRQGYGQQYNRDYQKYWQWIQDYFRRLQQYQQGQGFYR